MTLTIGTQTVVLKCDTTGCANTADLVLAPGVPAGPSHANQLRRQSFDRGWSRRRPRPTSSLEDYCPDCTRDWLGQGGVV